VGEINSEFRCDFNMSDCGGNWLNCKVDARRPAVPSVVIAVALSD